MKTNPAQMQEYDRAWRNRERRLSRRHAVLTSMFFNAHRGKGQEAASTEDFIDTEAAPDA